MVIINAGINERAGGATDRKDPAGRLKLLEANAKVYGDIVPRIVAVAPQAVILVVARFHPIPWRTLPGASPATTAC